MEPQDPQFDGQPSRIEKAVARQKASYDRVFKKYSDEMTPEERSESINSDKNLTRVLRTSSVDDLVSHTAANGVGLAMHYTINHPDINEGHLSQLAMSTNSLISHTATQHSKATDEHRVLHVLSHPQCSHCERDRKNRKLQEDLEKELREG